MISGGLTGTLDCAGSGAWSGVIAGIDWVANSTLRPAVANMSLGGAASASVDAAVSGFQQQLRAGGGLMGATAQEAFAVNCGVGATMTAQDVLEGDMIVQVLVALVHDGEFIDLTFKQKMEAPR